MRQVGFKWSVSAIQADGVSAANGRVVSTCTSSTADHLTAPEQSSP
jgi:hypothetical protein